MQAILAVVIPSIIVGASVVYFLPFGQGLLSKIQEPNVRRILDNRFVQVLLVGFVVSLGIGLFTQIARLVKVKTVLAFLFLTMAAMGAYGAFSEHGLDAFGGGVLFAGAVTPGAVLLQRHDFKNRQRQNFVANGQLVYDVVRGGYIERMIAELRGSLVVSGGTVSGTSLGENPGNLIQRIFVDAAPMGQIKSLSPRSLIRNTIVDYGRVISDAALTGAAGTFTLLQPFYLPFAFETLLSPIEAALESAAFTSIQCRVQLGGRDTQFAGSDRTFDFSGVSVDLLDQREVMSGRTAVVWEDDLVRNISGANPRFAISDFPLGQRYLMQSYIFETTSQQLSDVILNRITIFSGGSVFEDVFEDDSRVDLYRALKDAATALTGLHVWFASPLTGGKQTLRGAVDARTLSQMAAALDVSNPGTDRVIVASRRVLLAEDLQAA